MRPIADIFLKNNENKGHKHKVYGNSVIIKLYMR